MPTVNNIVYQDVVALNSGYTPSDSTNPNPTLYSPAVQELQQWQSGIINNQENNHSQLTASGGTQLRLNSGDEIGYVYVYLFIPI